MPIGEGLSGLPCVFPARSGKAQNVMFQQNQRASPKRNKLPSPDLKNDPAAKNGKQRNRHASQYIP